MAQKFGGEYSPNKSSSGTNNTSSYGSAKVEEYNPKRAKSKKRLRTYRALAFPIGIAGLITLISGNPISGLTSIASFFGILLAVEITKAGLEAEEEFNKRTIARAPSYPRKTIGAIMMGLIFAIEARFGVGTDWASSLGLGIAGFAGMLMAFGFDPMRAKGLAGQNRYEAGRAAEAIEKAQSYLNEIRNLSNNLSNRRARLEIENLAISAEEMFRALEEDPSDLRNSKRYLGVYLHGARDATAQYLALPKSEQTAEAEAKYLALIRELDQGFQQKRETILQDNRNTLNIEIDVLRERLASEGIKIPKEEKS